MLPGSGTGGVSSLPPPKPLVPSSALVLSLEQPLETVFVSIVTAPVCANALPQFMVASVFSVMLATARIFPSNAVALSRVAELPTCQNRLSSGERPRLMKATSESRAVVRAPPI